MLRPVLLGMWSVAILAACAAAGTGVRLGVKDGGRTVVLRTGDTVALSLAENPSTGYSWQVVSSGAPVLYLEFMFNAQGEDIVSGRRSAPDAERLSVSL